MLTHQLNKLSPQLIRNTRHGLIVFETQRFSVEYLPSFMIHFLLKAAKHVAQ